MRPRSLSRRLILSSAIISIVLLAVTGIGVAHIKERSKARRDTPSSYLLDISRHVRLATG